MFTTLNSTISKIYIKSIDFTHPLKSLDSLFTESSCIKAKEFRFKDCKFGSQAACDFFEAFTHYPAQIEILTFEICQFNAKSLDSFFQTLFFSNCFHNLQVFQIKDISGFDDLSFFLFQLVSCGWVLETHCLRYLGAPGCNLTLEQLIPQILQLDTEFSDLDLSGNNFKTPIKTKFDINRSFTTLILKNVNFGPKCLLSLLKSLQKVNHKFNLDISNCKMTAESWKDFYENLNQIKIQNLQSIIYDRNPLKPDNIQQFCSFIMNQPSLNSISISNCISKVDINSVVPQLTNLVNTKSIESLTIACTPENTLGGLILPIIFTALSKGTLKKLDISGQAGGERIMSQILQKMTPSLSEINFDGFLPSDGEAFLNICESFMERPYIKNITWPGSDVKGCLARTNPQQQNDLAKKIQQLKTQFSNKYGHVDEKFDSIIDKNLKTQPNDKHSSGYEMGDDLNSPPQDLIRSRCGLAENYESMKDFVKYDPETELLIKECKDVFGIDPVSKIFAQVNFHTQIDYLIQNIE
ncbi:hypothetical protein TVAG_173940 [Trichomonas vaginalis G3]|uniref:Leucine Rich Repeat family protein n=1 Tax=Trichomonas vaginalis (strain ATCC PRA-98 / G3) TaxID=412133 RepID=A2EWT7_TRIV3|nr:leucine-rich repeat, isoform f-related family [Trichomonas vaginalis G3]EAY02852.1 hypothetical protein TVAG_173940 [Trichomonas vaginalis G3]KAI5497366.1 leucine-rich repeat, isoform f-related family [Trichomonas vaginalis G3]|eukprot:XP_001315075.1 hypothetical protein [Trichomonas vaginalis G3]